MTKKYTYQEAKLKIEHWCAYQERCQFEVNQKLMAWKLNLEERNSIIADLISRSFIDEERFAEAYVSGKFRIKKWGKIKIKQHLKSKFISKYSIEKALKKIEKEDYYKTVLDLIEKKNHELNKIKDVYLKKIKIFNYLGSKGYEYDIMESAFDNFFS